MNRSTVLVGAALLSGALFGLSGCDKKPESTSTGTSTGSKSTADGHVGHDHGPGDKHDEHGPTVDLGTSAIGSFQVKASRDGAITAGGEAPIDLWITPGAGAKIGAVRAWIGTQDAAGSVKAKLELEKDNYHNHVEVPNPIPAASKLWVEIEDDAGGKTLGSFDLKT